MFFPPPQCTFPPSLSTGASGVTAKLDTSEAGSSLTTLTCPYDYLYVGVISANCWKPLYCGKEVVIRIRKTHGADAKRHPRKKRDVLRAFAKGDFQDSHI